MSRLSSPRLVHVPFVRRSLAVLSGLLLQAAYSHAAAQPASSGRAAPERVGIPLKFGTLDRVNSTLLGGPSVALQVERTGDAADPLRLRVIMRSLPDKGQMNAPAASISMEADAAIIYQAGPVDGTRQLDDPNSTSPVATDVYVLPLAKTEVNTILNAANLIVRARGKKVDVESKRLDQLRASLSALLAAADAGAPVTASAAVANETPRQVVSGGGGAMSQSSTVVVLQSKIVGGSATGPAQADSGSRRTPATTACGTGRLCAQGWDLRITRFVLDDSVFAPNGFLQSRVTIENRGSQRSEISEARICVASGAQCVGEAAVLGIPALQSGEKLEIAQPIPSYSGNDVAPPYSVVATIDPDRATSEANRTNNEAMIRSVTLDTAVMSIDNFDVPPNLRKSAVQLPVSITVRNSSKVATMSSRAVQFGGWCYGNRWGDVATRVKVPDLLPMQSWTAAIAIRDKRASSDGLDNCQIWVSPLKSTRGDEKENQELRIRRDYNVLRPDGQ